VIAYRTRSAIRDVGKALGLSPDTLSVMANTVWGSGGSNLNLGICAKQDSTLMILD